MGQAGEDSKHNVTWSQRKLGTDHMLWSSNRPSVYHHQQWYLVIVHACMHAHVHEHATVYVKITSHLWVFVQVPRTEHKDEEWGRVFLSLLVTI